MKNFKRALILFIVLCVFCSVAIIFGCNKCKNDESVSSTKSSENVWSDDNVDENGWT